MRLDPPLGETGSMALGTETLRAIARMHDPVGVLSVYVDVVSHEPAGGSPLWDEQVRVGLHHLAGGWDPDDTAAVRARLHALEPAIEQLLDPRTAGRGRALFAAVAGADIHEVRIALPLVTDVRLQPRAHMLPLLAAAEEGRAVGVAVVSAAELRLIDLDTGTGRELRRLDLSQPGFEWSLRKEPNAGVVENQHRVADSAAPEVERAARSHGWDTVVVAGNARIARRLAATLASSGLDVHIDDTDPAPEATAATIAELTAAYARATRQTREQQLVELVRTRAAAAGRGALGMAEVATALAEGRVEHLVLDARGTYPGTVTGDGRLVPVGAAPAAPVADIAGDLIERAFETNAKVTAVNGSAAQELAASEGIGALLRW